MRISAELRRTFLESVKRLELDIKKDFDYNVLFQKHSRTGRPLGSEGFIERYEAVPLYTKLFRFSGIQIRMPFFNFCLWQRITD
jgi:hypothetical protein